jgi:hypothetical protein
MSILQLRPEGQDAARVHAAVLPLSTQLARQSVPVSCWLERHHQTKASALGSVFGRQQCCQDCLISSWIFVRAHQQILCSCFRCSCARWFCFWATGSKTWGFLVLVTLLWWFLGHTDKIIGEMSVRVSEASRSDIGHGCVTYDSCLHQIIFSLWFCD